MATNYYFPGFEFCVDQLKKFIQAFEVFTIMLTNGHIVHYQPQNVSDFRNWLMQHEVEDLRLSYINTSFR